MISEATFLGSSDSFATLQKRSDIIDRISAQINTPQEAAYPLISCTLLPVPPLYQVLHHTLLLQSEQPP